MNQNELLSRAVKARHAEQLLKNDWSSETSWAEESPTNTQTSKYATMPDNDIFAAIKKKLLTPLVMQQSAERTLATVSTLFTSICPTDATHQTVFTELERLRADDEDFTEAIRDIRNAKAIPEHEALANRLEVLLDAYKEDYGESLNAESLRTFSVFMCQHPMMKRPIITATPDGNLFAEWKGEEGRRYLGVQFLPTSQVTYVAIRPNPQHAPLRIRISGQATADQLLTELSGHDVTSWAARVR